MRVRESRALYAWAALTGTSLALCIVVAVSAARAPSTTPFMACGAAAAVAGVAGAAVEVSKRRIPMSAAVHAAIVLGVAFITILPAGAVRYTYGSTGSLAITLTAAPLNVAWESPAVLHGTISLYNDGATTLRVRPIYEVRVLDPTGSPRPLVSAACQIPALPTPTERDLVEIPPGALVDWPFDLPIAWADQGSSGQQCGSVLIADHGAHQIVGIFESRPFQGFLLVPVWASSLTSQAAVLMVQ